MRRTPKNYDGTAPTGHLLNGVLSGVLAAISDKYQDRPDLVLAAWPMIVGEKIASMAEAVSFDEGTLVVKVKNSTLYSLLVQKERARLLGVLKKKFPTVDIRALHFRMG